MTKRLLMSETAHKAAPCCAAARASEPRLDKLWGTELTRARTRSNSGTLGLFPAGNRGGTAQRKIGQMRRPQARGPCCMDQPFQSRRNRLLELLPASDFDRLRPHLVDVSLDYKFELYGAGKPIPFVYFPVTGVASIVNTMMDGSAAEVGTVGNEGMVGLPVILGDSAAPNDVYVQVPGTGLRMPAN